jgi:hypothetical protein
MAAGANLGRPLSTSADEKRRLAESAKALVAVTLDLEMSRNFPTWETTHWDYEKGNLNQETKDYTVEACRRVKAAGGVLHSFAVGRVCEQENVDWLTEIARAGHPVGNHTYDHINILATRPEYLQARFRRAPWLVVGRPVAEVIRENIRLASAALRERVGVEAAGFRAPGGFAAGLDGRTDLQQMLQGLGFRWVSSKSPRYAVNSAGTPPGRDVFESIVQAQRDAQPLVYPTGLVEIPMSPASDIGAFRNGRWKLADFLKSIRLSLQWCLDHRAVFDFLGHPSCLYVTDPNFQAIDLICEMVHQAGDRAAIVDLGTIALRATARQAG